MADETELKFRIESLSGVRKALRAAGAEHLQTVLQTDRYFDKPDGALYRWDCGLRIRTVRRLKAGKGAGETRPLLTFKGPRRPGRKAKIRQEIETHLDNAEALTEILGACGMRLAMTVQKRRSSYRMSRCRVELDTLPLIGCFVEIEGPSERAIASVCRKLSLPGQSITSTYAELISEYCRVKRISSRNAIFK